jgi:hypothetical protein
VMGAAGAAHVLRGGVARSSGGGAGGGLFYSRNADNLAHTRTEPVVRYPIGPTLEVLKFDSSSL